jgi:hypothetical protein
VNDRVQKRRHKGGGEVLSKLVAAARARAPCYRRTCRFIVRLCVMVVFGVPVRLCCGVHAVPPRVYAALTNLIEGVGCFTYHAKHSCIQKKQNAPSTAA